MTGGHDEWAGVPDSQTSLCFLRSTFLLFFLNGANCRINHLNNSITFLLTFECIRFFFKKSQAINPVELSKQYVSTLKK